MDLVSFSQIQMCICVFTNLDLQPLPRKCSHSREPLQHITSLSFLLSYGVENHTGTIFKGSATSINLYLISALNKLTRSAVTHTDFSMEYKQVAFLRYIMKVLNCPKVPNQRLSMNYLNIQLCDTCIKLSGELLTSGAIIMTEVTQKPGSTLQLAAILSSSTRCQSFYNGVMEKPKEKLINTTTYDNTEAATT